MAFHEVRFPDDISYGSKGGPKFKTTILELDSGFEQRNIDWSQIRCEFDVSYGIKDESQMASARAFFMARRGRAHGFRYKDWHDYRITAQLIGVGDGATTTFQVVKVYEPGSNSFTRKLTKLVSGTLTTPTIGGNPALWASLGGALDYNTGIITFITPPADDADIVIPSLDFDVPVRFDVDFWNASHDDWQLESVSLPLVEVRLKLT